LPTDQRPATNGPRPAFLITGSGRSGTSAVARLLHEAGLALGHDLIEPDEHNAEGYFEERRLIEINDYILRDAGLGPWFTTATRKQVLDAAKPHEEAMRALVAEATPAWKDPRFCWTLEAWLPLLPAPPAVIVCLRSPREVVASTLRYYAQAGDEAERAVLHVWRTQYERLLEVIRDHRLRATCVEYGALHRAPKRTAAALSRFVGRRLDSALVRKDLRHHRSDVPSELRALYDSVLTLGG